MRVKFVCFFRNITDNGYKLTLFVNQPLVGNGRDQKPELADTSYRFSTKNRHSAGVI
jgi:hypothetical protein